MSLIEVKHLKKVYTTRFQTNRVEALKDINFTVDKGEYVAVMGESGSGKTTLLNILASLDHPTGGEVLLEGINICELSDSQLSKFRRENLGFVFQDFNLLDTLNLKDNILLPLVLAGVKYPNLEQQIQPLSKKLHIDHILNHFPYEVSGGQKQRCALCRAMITNPKLILADEPTGALDSKSSQDILELFDYLNDEGNTILMVTHSTQVASHAKRVLFIKDGLIYHQIYRGEKTQTEMYESISKTLTVMATGGKVYD